MIVSLWILLAIIAVVSVILLFFMKWRRAAYRRAATGSRVAQIAHGPIEYAVVGAGPVVLVLHGGLGGFDQGLLLGNDLGIPQAFMMLCPSRAGYLRTPLATCTTPQETADACAALLDELNIADVAVVGISGGGPTALQFALRHAGRTRALLMICAISHRHEQPERTQQVFGWLIFSNAGMWAIDLVCWLFQLSFMRWRPAWLAKRLFKATETLNTAARKRRVEQFQRDPRQIAWLRRFIDLHLPISLRKVGLDNDLAQFAQVPDYPLQRISCPTLVVHGRFDGNVPLDHAEYVAQRVPGAELAIVEDCGHLIWLSRHVDETQTRVMEFLRQHQTRSNQGA